MNKLDENQEKAANHFYGTALVLAGPGSGKTTVLTERTMRLSGKIGSANKILSVTFTNAAATEMENRYIKKYEGRMNGKCQNTPVFKTVHSLCNYFLSIYEEQTGNRFTRLTSETEICKIIKEIYFDVNGSDASDSVLKYILQSKNQKRKDSDVKNILRVSEKYKLYKKENNMIDFDDMISHVYDILNSNERKDKSFCDYITNMFDFIQVDEAQDLTREQFVILEKIGAKGNIFVVADDDQSIYGFRGAEPKNLFIFKEKYSDCKVYHLSRNYRSCNNIVSLSKKIIGINTQRFEKDLFTLNDQGIEPKLLCFKNIIKQGTFIVDEIIRLRSDEPSLSVGILFRNNFSGIIPGVMLAKKGMNYKKESGCILTREISCIDKLIKNLRDEERGHMFVPTPGKVFKKMLEDGFENDVARTCKNEGKEVIYKSFLMMFFDYLCNKTENLCEVIRLLEIMDYNDINSNISLSTVHSSKGLEFDVVFVIDMIMGVFPGKNSMEIGTLEEERRLFYVAATRAKKYLYVTYPMGNGKNYMKKSFFDKSIFVREIEQFI